ncbi:PREDICTED: F-box/FBD/LRR-repeat protein At1g13570-like [Ipomoea nil]|uniref:F-box/FBD/LRR-repeat protein At1g13570-like n=1 Tax=Ipomoea nil TaxID=35883 RepID=UPI000900CE01|nr:PREDICTED: F-box/FBD/LRR-repeat protein At1g13570-like [Ipomoea nil]XP_019194861.1 PREDICTED: F-box/FBD/LRR-repeat protein At1g13570-like [Ipomoea nil]
MMSGRDRIRQLPIEILDNILGFLPIVEAARTAVLSTIWRDCWSSLTQLNFDDKFFAYVGEKYSGSYNRTSTCMYVINKVLMRHHGPIRKFALVFDCDSPIMSDTHGSRKFDFDQWFLFITQKGVEEMNFTFRTEFGPNTCFGLPNCILSCSTLKRLDLCGVIFPPTINAPFVFPNVTSLSFDVVIFSAINMNCVIDVPMLETLSFNNCVNTSYFNIKAPRLGSLTLQYYCNDDDIDDYVPILPVSLDLSFIHTLCLDFNFKPFKLFASELTRWGPELNVECVELYDVNVLYDDDFSSFIHSLLICPKLRKLDITHLYFYAEISRSILWEELQSAAKVLKMLHTFKLRLFNGSRFELQFIEVLLACFPALEKVVIIRQMEFDSNEEFKIMQKFFHFPRASKKAKIVYI